MIRRSRTLLAIAALACWGAAFSQEAPSWRILKPSNTVTGPCDPAPLPPHSTQYDWEVELGIVIGSEASYLGSVEEASKCIAGYVTANDFSERGNGPRGNPFPGPHPWAPGWFRRGRSTAATCGCAAG